MTSTLNQSLSIPNLPGMTPNKRSWLYREVSKEGFKKAPTARPITAMPVRTTSPMYERSDIFNGNQTGEIDFRASNNRPSSANLLAVSMSNPQLMTRPSTAGPAFGRASTGSLLQSTSSANLPVKLPRYVETDKQVCRFFGHFYQQRPWESNGPLGNPVLEQKMVRKMTFYFYIYDNTVEISEPRTTNSGLPQGIFFRRGQITKDDEGTRVVLEDFAPGNSIRILGREFHITDADAFTRDYFKRELNTILPPSMHRPTDIPTDNGAMYATGLGTLSNGMSKSNYNTRSTDYLVQKEVLDKTNRFLQFDGQVLRFLCVEVDRFQPPFFTKVENEVLERGENLFAVSNGHGFLASDNAKKFALSFYLSSLDIDLVVQRETGHNANATMEPKLILKKSRLPKNWRDVQRGRPGMYYESQDFQCGTVVDVYGRLFLLVGCDAYTHQHYAQMGIYQNEVPLIPENVEKIVQPIPELGDGSLPIGSKEDTLATVYGMPKVRKDMLKVSKNQGRLLRCKAVLATDNPIDTSREFLVSFFLEDDSIQVFEEVKRNSGIWGGNFLKRGKYMNEAPHDSHVPRHFAATDIYLGNIITLNGNRFHITDMDNLSLKFCETYPDEFPMSDVFRIVGNILLQLIKAKADLKPLFEAGDRQKKGTIDSQAFVDAMDGLDLTESLNDQEMLTLLRRFREGEQVHYLELCDMISHLHFQHYRINNKASKLGDVTVLSNLITSAKSRTIQWRRTLRKDSNSSKGCMTLAALTKVFKKNGMTLNENMVREIGTTFKAGGESNDRLLSELRSKGDAKGGSHVRNQLMQATSMAAKIAELRKKTPNATLRQNSKSGIPGSGASVHMGVMDLSAILVDYNKLCDAIYPSEWMN